MFSRMKYLSRLFLLIILLLVCFTCSTPSINVDTTNNTQNELDGAYEFLSEEIDFTAPKKNKYDRRYPDWSGLWIFKDGHFSRVVMKSNSRFQKNSKRELEYLSEAGTYKMPEGKLELRIKFAYFAYDLQSLKRYEFNLSNNILTLTRRVPVSVENLNEHIETIVLRRIKDM